MEQTFNPLFMHEALIEANKAAEKNECPIGAIIIYDNQIIARAHNLRELSNQTASHAEMLCIAEACEKLGSWRLNDCDIYITLEPCPMCAGAIIQARFANVFFGAYDSKAGAAGSVVNLFEHGLFNHNVNVHGGIMKKECQEKLSTFFKNLRKNKR